MRAGRRSLTSRHRKRLHQSTQRQLVAISSEATDHSQRSVGQSRASTLRLARVDVGQMDLDEWNFHSRERVTNGETGVAVRSGVDERTIGVPAQGVNSIDDFPFPIVLRERELDAELLGDLQEPRLD